MRPGFVPMPLVLRVNAVVSVLFGVVLLAATWEGLYDALDIPAAAPVGLRALLGAVLLGLAWIAWRAASDDGRRCGSSRRGARSSISSAS